MRSKPFNYGGHGDTAMKHDFQFLPFRRVAVPAVVNTECQS
jgi:hypothetical protein